MALNFVIDTDAPGEKLEEFPFTIRLSITFVAALGFLLKEEGGPEVLSAAFPAEFGQEKRLTCGELREAVGALLDAFKGKAANRLATYVVRRGHERCTGNEGAQSINALVDGKPASIEGGPGGCRVLTNFRLTPDGGDVCWDEEIDISHLSVFDTDGFQVVILRKPARNASEVKEFQNLQKTLVNLPDQTAVTVLLG